MNYRFNSQRAALAKALLDGKELSIMTAFEMIYCTNLPREISRAIMSHETGFGAVIKKTRVDFTSTYGHKGYYFTYKLEHSEANKESIKKMREYLAISDVKPISKSKNKQYLEQDIFTTLDAYD
jgi:RNA binding exosome subunit